MLLLPRMDFPGILVSLVHTGKSSGLEMSSSQYEGVNLGWVVGALFSKVCIQNLNTPGFPTTLNFKSLEQFPVQCNKF